jgi:4-hydroxybenzoate polyprenyltransferase
MKRNVIHFIFFANYFVGFIAVVLSVETAYQLKLPLCPVLYYLLLFAVTVLYYTSAYTETAKTPGFVNPRTKWYQQHHIFVHFRQTGLLIFSILTTLFFFFKYQWNIFTLPLPYWLVLLPVPIAALLYYGWVPQSLVQFNLRNTGWLKAFVIGFAWAGTSGILPVVACRILYHTNMKEPELMLWLFIKNWIFCTVNAIMFDIKDYSDDANKQLKTFVVRMGLRRTIYFILIPLLLIGITALILFAVHRRFGFLRLMLNLIPFFCLLYVAFALQKRKQVLYYLIVIDGLLLLKALCGILGMFFV